MRPSSCKPFLRWAGGKRSILESILEKAPQEFSGRYFEPFLGGGAVLLGSNFDVDCIAGDVNAELINCYNHVRDSLPELIELLKSAMFENSAARYKEIRSWDRSPSYLQDRHPLERAARFIYLNRLGFNGIYRVNRDGYYNVPYGGNVAASVLDEFKLHAASMKLQKVVLEPVGYAELFFKYKPRSGDFVYFDPPYDPISATSAFVGYTKDGFGNFDQERLAQCAVELAREGVHVVVSNSDTPRVRDLYLFDGSPFSGRSVSIPVRRSISASAMSRGHAAELIISSN